MNPRDGAASSGGAHGASHSASIGSADPTSRSASIGSADPISRSASIGSADPTSRSASIGGPAAPGSDADRAARVVLTRLVEPGNRTVWSLVQEHGAVATVGILVRGEIPDASLRARVQAKLAGADPQRLAAEALDRAERLGARIVVPSDAEWPPRVDELSVLELGIPGSFARNVRPPLCIWARGPLPLGKSLARSVAVVGSRAATAYGTQVTADIAYGLAERDWTVVSGGAFGIDAAAHRAALAAGGRTVAVLACGVDRPYPAGNAALFEEVVRSGLLISEWPPGAEPMRHRFLVRNRVIAAATAGTVLVEAAARSGGIQTMSRVLALRRAAMVVPGPVTSAMSVGCHELLRSRPDAILVTGVEQVLDAVGGMGEYPAERPRGPEHRRDRVDEESAELLEALPGRGTVTAEQLAARSGLPLRTVLRRLSLLELAGLVERRAGAIALRRRSAPP